MLFVSGSFLLPLLVECVASPSVRDVVRSKRRFLRRSSKKAVESFLPQKKAEQPPTEEREGFLSIHE
jgi:hypothetical protein